MNNRTKTLQIDPFGKAAAGLPAQMMIRQPVEKVKINKQIKPKRSDSTHIDNIVREVMSYKRDENGLLIGVPK